MDLVNSFWELYNSLVTAMLPPLVEGDGEKEEHILGAETKLGLKLPSLLREYYIKTANRDDINNARDRLVNVDELYLRDDHLVFYEENQCVVFWGIDRSNIGDNDPKVLQGTFTSDDTEHADWSDWSDEGTLPLSEFLISMLIMQIDVLSPAVHCYGRCDRYSITYPSDWNRYVCHLDGRSEVYWKSGRMIRISSGDKKVDITGIALSKADAIDMAKTFGVDWTSD